MTRRGINRSGWWIAGAVLVSGFAAAWSLGLGPAGMAELLQGIPKAVSRYFQADWQYLPVVMSKLLETAVMGVWGTILAIVLGLPATALASRGLGPNRFIEVGSREGLSFLRAMPDALLALIFVQGVGIGPFAGILALGLHMAGVFGKIMADAIERLDTSVITGLQSTGASWLQVIRFGAWPSIEREVLSYSLYMVDRNIRVAAMLGLVGAGGIGVELQQAIKTFDLARAGTSIALVIGLVLVVDAASNELRRRLA